MTSLVVGTAGRERWLARGVCSPEVQHLPMRGQRLLMRTGRICNLRRTSRKRNMVVLGDWNVAREYGPREGLSPLRSSRTTLVHNCFSSRRWLIAACQRARPTIPRHAHIHNHTRGTAISVSSLPPLLSLSLSLSLPLSIPVSLSSSPPLLLSFSRPFLSLCVSHPSLCPARPVVPPFPTTVSPYLLGREQDFYDVREMIGHGTSGEVRRAINRTTGKQVAVKVIETRKFALTPGLTPKELVQEAEMLKRVDHEYIIKLEDIFQARGRGSGGGGGEGGGAGKGRLGHESRERGDGGL